MNNTYRIVTLIEEDGFSLYTIQKEFKYLFGLITIWKFINQPVGDDKHYTGCYIPFNSFKAAKDYVISNFRKNNDVIILL